LLTSTGRKSGKARTLPLQYFMDGSTYVITAPNWGRDEPPAWWLNLQGNPRAMIQVGRQVVPVVAEQANPEQKRRLWALLIARDATFARYQQRTTRDIPMVILRPTAVV